MAVWPHIGLFGKHVCEEWAHKDVFLLCAIRMLRN
jgi:hypothetical protein